MRYHYHQNFSKYKTKVETFVTNFNISGKDFVIGNRNSIKLFELDGKTISIKSFKKPNIINKIAYKYFRKSKARRSFEYASKLIELQIGTPKPIAFYENYDLVGLLDSYYACEHLENVFEFRAIVQDENFENREEIIRQFTKFSAFMHEKGVEFLDHSPGNTLIKNNDNGIYSFYLVDLNRMKFHTAIDFSTRMKNLSKITHKKDMIATMSNEYAKILGIDEKKVFEYMWKFTEDFQFRFQRKKRIKRQLKFWKK